MYLVPSPNAWGSLRERGGDGHLFWIVLFAGVGLKKFRKFRYGFFMLGASIAGTNWWG